MIHTSSEQLLEESRGFPQVKSTLAFSATVAEEGGSVFPVSGNKMYLNVSLY